MKTTQTKTGIKSGDEVVYNGQKCIVWATYTDADGLDMVEVERDGYLSSDNLVPASSVRKSAEQTLAEKYNVPVERIYSEKIYFVQSEGYLEKGDRTIECQTFDQWLFATFKRPERLSIAPFQKGDLGYGL
jgi:hypothetical protein